MNDYAGGDGSMGQYLQQLAMSGTFGACLVSTVGLTASTFHYFVGGTKELLPVVLFCAIIALVCVPMFCVMAYIYQKQGGEL